MCNVFHIINVHKIKLQTAIKSSFLSLKNTVWKFVYTEMLTASQIAAFKNLKLVTRKIHKIWHWVIVTSSETRLERCDMNTNTYAPVLFSGSHIRLTQHGTQVFLRDN